MRFVNRMLLFSMAFLGLTVTAKAQVLWTVSGTFSDGGVLSGSFVYDANTNTYSNINVKTTTGSVRIGATYTALDGPPRALQLAFVTGTGNLTGTPVLFMEMIPPLTNNGGTVILDEGREQSCDDSGCTSFSAPNRDFTGTAIGVPISVDSASWWFWYVTPWPQPAPAAPNG